MSERKGKSVKGVGSVQDKREFSKNAQPALYKNLLTDEEIVECIDIHHKMLAKINDLFSNDCRRFASPQKLSQKINHILCTQKEFNIEKARSRDLYVPT
jgi:hypothetical protein